MSTNVGTVLPNKNTLLEISKSCEISIASSVSVKRPKELTVVTSSQQIHNVSDFLQNVKPDGGIGSDNVASNTKSSLILSMGQLPLASVQMPQEPTLLEGDSYSHKRKKRKEKNREREYGKSSNHRNYSKDKSEKKVEGKYSNHHILKSSHSSTSHALSRHISNKSVVSEDCNSSKNLKCTSEENKCRSNSHSSNSSKMKIEETSIDLKLHDKKRKVLRLRLI